MPPTLTYPGVYIEELPSAVHTITGVATSIAAFVGWSPQGSTTDAVLVQSFLDYQREFGGLDSRSLMGYSVSQFFNNGGQQAYIVRLASGAITTGTGPNQVPLGSGTATEGAVKMTASTQIPVPQPNQPRTETAPKPKPQTKPRTSAKRHPKAIRAKKRADARQPSTRIRGAAAPASFITSVCHTLREVLWRKAILSNDVRGLCECKMAAGGHERTKIVLGVPNSSAQLKTPIAKLVAGF